MSLPTEPLATDDRVPVAIALLAAGGVLSPLPGPAGLGLAIVALIAARPLFAVGSPHPRASRGWIAPLGVALLLALLVRALARLVIATPALLLALPLLGLLAVIPRIAAPLGRTLASSGLAVALIGVGLIGVAIEQAGPTPRGMVHSGPLLGVHPRQAVAVTIDGFGPHDVIADDYVEPGGEQGRDPASWAARLEAELHAIAELHYAEGPARAREAFAHAEVAIADPIVPADEREHYPILVGIRVSSGTTGEGSRVEFGCPGRVLDPRRDALVDASGECPRKYARDGSTGLGLSPRWPGYTEQRGRDRLRLAGWLDWPSGDEARDRRVLAIELGCVALAVLLASLALAGRARSRVGASEPAMLGLLALFGVALLRPSAAIGSGEVGMLLPLAALIVVVGPGRPTTRVPMVLVPIVVLALSPLAGRAGPLELEGALVELLVVDLGVGWAQAGVIAAAIAMLAIAPGTLACARTLLERETAGPLALGSRVLAALAITIGLAMRKPGDDPALLGCAAALVLACALARDRSTPRRWVFAVLLALAAGSPLLGPGPRDPVAFGLLVAGSLLTLLAGLASDRDRGRTPVEP
ncbi:hypothetical protein ACNOYE_28410 [Nannocystaceae bacterium ST9]